MSHQVLARKWRPRAFDALVGQDHVVKALTHALETNRLHHAYLFTGTRGVGKTTIARILAKAVNCEQGMSATPCGECGACTQIDGGGFVDYLELDAASNRGVDEMVQILNNAVYAPTAGRYKVYVIDEVHMLTAHAFNAMLKTLEEPPPHMLFILATTDPQKVPVTVLSRCMQFNLRNMQAPAIAEHLAKVLDAEKVSFEAPALDLLGRAAAGSMRDALSLTDQAIAAGAGAITEAQVRDMLGMIDSAFVGRVLAALKASDGPALVAIADEIAEAPEAADRLLGDLAIELADMAAAQAAGQVRADTPEFDASEIQVFYQIAVHGQRDLPLAPDPRAGVLMTLLRMLAFSGEIQSGAPARASDPGPSQAPAASGGAAAAARAALAASQGGKTGRAQLKAASPSRARSQPPPARSPIAADKPVNTKTRDVDTMTSQMPPEPPPADDESMAAPAAAPSEGDKPSAKTTPVAGEQIGEQTGEQIGKETDKQFDGDWPALARLVALNGRPGQFMTQSQLEKFQDDHIWLRVPIEQLAEQKLVARVAESLSRHIGSVRLSVTVGPIDGDTAAREFEAERLDRLQAARVSLEADPFVKTLLDDFDATIVPDSIRALDGGSLNQGENS